MEIICKIFICSINVRRSNIVFIPLVLLSHHCVFFYITFGCLHVGLAAVMTMSVTTPKLQTYDGVPIWEAMRRLEEAGAAVVGINCFRGPTTMLPLIPEIRRACKVGLCHVIGYTYDNQL